jgi:hypothetical protein
MNVVFTHVVLAGKRMLKISEAFVEGSACRTATLSVVHTDGHGSLAFYYARNNSTKWGR